MKRNFKISSILPFAYVLFAFLPCLYLLYPPVMVNKPSDIGTLILLAVFQIIFAFSGIISRLDVPFEDYKKQYFVIKDLTSNPEAEKSSSLSKFAMICILYSAPLIFSIGAINVFLIKQNIGPGLLIATGCLVYNLCVIAALIVRISKLYEYMEKTAQEDFEWEVAKRDVIKLIRSLTTCNVSLEFTPGFIKDKTFVEFKDMIISRILRLDSYQALSDDKKLILLRDDVIAAGIYEIQVCSMNYVEIQWNRVLGPFFIVQIARKW